MHVGVRSVLIAGKICRALLLAVAPIALIVPGGGVALGQTGTGTAMQPPLFTAIDLHPSGSKWSVALGVSGEQQVGVGSTPEDYEHALLWRGSAASVVDLGPSGGLQATATCGGQQVGYGSKAGIAHALLWRGNAADVVDLNPSGFNGSAAFGTSSAEQVGDGGPATGGDHALLWRGSAASVVDLNPRGFIDSNALGTADGQQVGWGYGPSTGTGHHALLWRGSATSVVDLHPHGFRSSEAHGTSGGQQVGYGDGPATGAFSDTGIFHDHALLWRGNAASVVDLTPPGFISSSAYATNGTEQVGVGYGPAARDEAHALLWRGSAASMVDLHTFLPPGFVFSTAMAIDAAGDVVGSASSSTGPGSASHAILWKRNVPKPGTSRGQNTMPC